jgi:hypothetical protein
MAFVPHDIDRRPERLVILVKKISDFGDCFGAIGKIQNGKSICTCFISAVWTFHFTNPRTLIFAEAKIFFPLFRALETRVIVFLLLA